MKKIVLILMLAIVSMGIASAQHEVKSLSLQPKIGLNLSKLTNHFDSNFKPGMVVGLETEWQSKAKFGWSVGLLYSQQGTKYALGEFKYTYNYNYINVPVLANFYVARNLALKTGLQFGFNVSNGYTIEGPGSKENRNDPDVKAVEASIPLGVSYEFNQFVVEARYNLGLTYAVPRTRFSTFQFTLGYRFDVVKGN
ncbi:MAG: porin family protein [Prevotella conceptionensis]